MEKSNKRLLVNAEAFGYGPTAAIASFFPHLRKRFETIGYIGQGHTLDLQRSLDYDALHDTSEDPRRLEPGNLAEVTKGYDLFLTAMDFSMARHAKAAGLPTIVYDAISWYWSQIPEALKGVDFYLAQNFFGVKERLQSQSYLFPDRSEVVSPIIPPASEKREGEHVLINFGGLKHPFWNSMEAARYAANIVKALLEVIPADEKLVIATSASITRKLMAILSKEIEDNRTFNRFAEARQGSLTRQQVMEMLHRSKYAYMTPGLGNIYDAARFDLPTVWLPPSNDSQGQQLDLIREHGMVDAHADWSNLRLALNIDYRGDQQQVIRNIRYAIGELSDNHLKDVLAEATDTVRDQEGSLTSGLIDRFGTSGELQVAEKVYQFAQDL